MSLFRFLVLIATLAMLSVVVGCSGSGSGNSVAPQTPGISSNESDSLPVLGLVEEGGIYNEIGMMGAYELTINADELTADLIAKRYNSIGEDYIVSGIGFFTKSPCPDCLKLAGLSITPTGELILKYSVRHPFNPGDPTKPPTALNRKDLDVFDLALVVVPQETTATEYLLSGVSVYDQACYAPDGYTKELASLISDNAAMPYFLVVDDTVTGTKTFNKFAMGQSAEFEVGFKTTVSGRLLFDLYLTMGYGASAKKLQRLNPKYYNPEFNRKAAWKVNIVPPQGTNPPVKGNTWDNVDTTTPFNIRVEVYDWQIGAGVTANPADYANETDTTKVYAASEVSSVSCEVLGVTGTTSTKVSGTGMPGTPAIFEVPIINSLGYAEGLYPGLIKVTDGRAPLTPADGRDFLIDSPDGIALNNYTIPEYVMYQTFTATVVVGNTAPTCDFTLSDASVDMGGSTLCIPGTMTDNTAIISYEWDLDYDGTTFDADVTQNSVDPGFGDSFMMGPFCNPTYVDTMHTVALRVTDDATPALSTICTQEINVLANWAPGTFDVRADTINRGEGGQDAELITSVTLDWDAVPCAEEYVIQKTDNWYVPATWSTVGTSTTNSYSYAVGSTAQETGHRLRVYARLYTGDDTYRSANSEEVLLCFTTGFMAAPLVRLMDRTRELLGDTVNPSLAAGGFTLGTADGNVDAYPADNLYTYASFTNPANYYSFTNRWAGHYVQIPDLPGQTTAYVDAYVRTVSNPNYVWVTGGGWCFGTYGTAAPVRDVGIPTVPDFLPTNSARGSLYTYETANIEGFNTEYLRPNQAGFQAISGGTQWQHTSYYLNDLMNADRNFFAISYAVGSTNPATIASPAGYLCIALTDAIAIVVY